MESSANAHHARLMRLVQEAESDAGTASDWEKLRENHQFVRDDEEGDARSGSWERRMALKYYHRLSKEYAIADLSRYKESKLGLRWRVEREVVEGRGQFTCGNKECKQALNLQSYEVNFKYKEGGQAKNELVKVRMCPACAQLLFYKQIKRLKRKVTREEERAGDGHGEGSSARMASRSPVKHEEREANEKINRESRSCGDLPACSYEICRKGQGDINFMFGHELVEEAFGRYGGSNGPRPHKHKRQKTEDVDLTDFSDLLP